MLTRDSVTVAVDAVVYYRVQNATMSITNVEDSNRSTRLLAATTLRNVLGTKNLSEILSERESISHLMQVCIYNNCFHGNQNDMPETLSVSFWVIFKFKHEWNKCYKFLSSVETWKLEKVSLQSLSIKSQINYPVCLCCWKKLKIRYLGDIWTCSFHMVAIVLYVILYGLLWSKWTVSVWCAWHQFLSVVW